jgi:hypothetical protein
MYPREVKTSEFTVGNFMPNGDPAPCDVIRESDQERCLRCRKTWDAGDNPYCAKFFKPKISVRSVQVRVYGRLVERFQAIATWRTPQGRVRTWKGRPFHRSRGLAYVGGMQMLEVALKRKWVQTW